MSPADVTLYRIRDHYRSQVICDAWAQGLQRAGVPFQAVYEDELTQTPDAQLPGRVAIFYGLAGDMPRIFKAYRDDPARKAVYVDLGYWGRREGGRWTGFHKLAVDARHPTAYFQGRPHGADRLAMFHVERKGWHADVAGDPEGADSTHILLAGMGDKGARAEGFEPEEWERWAIGQIREHTERPIRYRPKPSWKEARPIEGCEYSPPTRDLVRELRNCWAVVTHHSNVAVDAIMAGVPAFCWGGVALEMSSQDLSKIETPYMPEGRWRWAADIAYTQWSVAEMASGAAWRYLTEEGLL